MELLYLYDDSLHVHVSSNILLILRRSNCINTASSVSVSDRPVHRSKKNSSKKGQLLLAEDNRDRQLLQLAQGATSRIVHSQDVK
jgi:hypothetical protein